MMDDVAYDPAMSHWPRKGREGRRRMNPAGAQTPDIPVVAIIGGGFTGATTAFHLARDRTQAVRIVVIEPRDRLGQGLAYATADPSHRINVPAARITMDCAEKSGLQNWLNDQARPLSPGSRIPTGEVFVQRGVVADYVGHNLAPHLASGRIVHKRAKAIAALRKGGRFIIACDDDSQIAADLVVIATSHPPPAIPNAFAAVARSPRLIADSAAPARLSKVARLARNVLVVGTGLTSADVIASLDRQGYGGQITALSRRGLRSRGHAFGYGESPATFAENPSRSALALLRRIRQAVAQDSQSGLPWQATLDNVRRDGAAIWAELPMDQREKLVRRLRIWWDVHRFRIAPQIEAVLDRLIAEHRLQIVAAHLKTAVAKDNGIAVSWRGRDGQVHDRLFDAIILTTGPAHGDVVSSCAVLASLAGAGLVRADPLHLGLDVTEGCRALAGDGSPTHGLFVAGPLARGHIGELMGIPEVTAHAELVASTLAMTLLATGRWSEDRQDHAP